MKSPASSRTRSLRSAVLGIWRLKSRVDVDSSGRRLVDPALGSDPLGMLCFSPGHFAAQFMKRDRSATTAMPAPPQGGNNSSAINGYDAYFGTYTLEESTQTLRVRLEGALSPSNIGAEFERSVHAGDDELIISLPTTAADGTPVTRTLTFSRLGKQEVEGRGGP